MVSWFPNICHNTWLQNRINYILDLRNKLVCRQVVSNSKLDIVHESFFGYGQGTIPRNDKC
jgi:hypothetical protein